MDGEQPIYVLKYSPIKELIREFFKVIGLSILFLLLIYANDKIVFEDSIPSYAYIIAAVLLGIAIVIDYFIARKRYAGTKYLFFRDRVEFNGEHPWNCSYSQISSFNIEKDLTGKITGKETLVINNMHRIRQITNARVIYDYILRLRQG